MSPCRVPLPPAWLHLACALALALVLRAWCPVDDGPQLAFWPLFVVASNGSGRASKSPARSRSRSSPFAVHYLWLFAKAIGGLFREFGELVVKGARQTWRFFRWTYEAVLKPAWQKFFKFVDDTKRALERIGRPVFDFLRWMRKHVLDFYARFVRPVLDFIGVTRKLLHVLQVFGLDWARRLDHALADLEAKIDAPFRLLLAEINKVINVVNRVVTADGLFQRLALVKSMRATTEEVWWQLGDGYRRGMTDEKRAALLAARAGPPIDAGARISRSNWHVADRPDRRAGGRGRPEVAGGAVAMIARYRPSTPPPGPRGRAVEGVGDALERLARFTDVANDGKHHPREGETHTSPIPTRYANTRRTCRSAPPTSDCVVHASLLLGWQYS
jgi:hypothetical protein